MAVNQHLQEVKQILDKLYTQEHTFSFLDDDPVQIPRRYQTLQDKELVGFWVAMLAWGQRKTIINKSNALFDIMGGSPYDFIVNLNDEKRQLFKHWKHRTFNETDTLYFLEYFYQYYQEHESLETAFLLEGDKFDAKESLVQFHNQFFAHSFAPQRTRKHVATPARQSACKRINLFLKWMVRQDERSGDLGIWKQISRSQLMIPVDVHVMKTAVSLGITNEQPVKWKVAEEVTQILRLFDKDDPVKYDYPLFVYSRYADEIDYQF